MKISRNFFIACVRAYQLSLGPLFQSLGVQCRFTPSCSHYASECLRVHGVFRGAWLSLRRLARCHPLCLGGHDPVPTPELQHGNG